MSVIEGFEGSSRGVQTVLNQGGGKIRERGKNGCAWETRSVSLL